MTDLESLIFQILLKADRPLHGLDISTRARFDHGKDILPGTLYKVVHRLEREGYLKSFWEDGRANPHRGPRRCYYEIAAERRAVQQPDVRIGEVVRVPAGGRV